jgi:hypothetical protein
MMGDKEARLQRRTLGISPVEIARVASAKNRHAPRGGFALVLKIVPRGGISETRRYLYRLPVCPGTSALDQH